ncbi:MAG TPA: hypothetical protein VG309_05220 [Rhizomicrobium sp.]|jgi:hypothetical protein|nr:hypothetical protein [Rhizomicrobium sp.]
MLRLIGGIIAGLVVWAVVVTLLNFGLRYGLPGYTAVEKAMNFTVTMMIARLSISAISSLASGWAAAAIANRQLAATVAGFLLLLVFIPVHYSIWSHFPIWYHLTFLISLPVLSIVGGKFARGVV